MRTKGFLVFALAAFILSPSCTRRPLDLQSDGVVVILDNDYSMPYKNTDDLPYNYNVMMYDRSNGTLRYEDFCGVSGGPIVGNAGSYTTYVYDADNIVTLFGGRERANTLLAYTEEAPYSVKAMFVACKYAYAAKVLSDGKNIEPSSGKAGFEGDLIIKEPDVLFAGKNDDVDIPVLAYSDENYIIPVHTDYALSQGRLTVRGITGTQYIGNVQVFITNLARGKYIVKDEVLKEPATMAFYMQDFNEGIMQGVFNYFGKIEDETLDNTAYIVITDTGGGRYLFVYDITRQIVAQEDDADIALRIDFDIPQPSDAGNSGFQPALSDWNNIWYDTPIG